MFTPFDCNILLASVATVARRAAPSAQSRRRRWAPRSARRRRRAAIWSSSVAFILAVQCWPTSASADGADSTSSVSPPHVVEHVDAVYPASALKERKHADVVLTLTVDVDGHVSDVGVAQSGGSDLDEAAIVAARQWVFTPAMRGGIA